MESFQSLYNQIAFLFSNLTWFGVLDLALVTTAFYFLLSLIRRSSASYLMREILLLGLALFVLTTLLPLPVFDWLIRGVLVALLVATPIIFQAQLRRFLERMGRASGIAQAVRESTAERVIPEIVHGVENWAATQTGALIVLEGNDSLEEIVKTGVASGGQVTSELLESIFYMGTPLHDGAVIVRGDRIMAAGCVLPLTQQYLEAEKRLGTRHRAAVGMSETSDALVVVVSEETGKISVAQGGYLYRPLTTLELREKLLDFYEPLSTSPKAPSWWSLIKKGARQLWHPDIFREPKSLLSNVGLLSIAVMLSLIVWSFVIEQTNPLQLARVEDIELRVENLPANTRMIPSPPETVSAVIQTTESVLPTLSPESFQATVTLLGKQPGLYRLPIDVNTGARPVLVLSVDPPALDFELAPIISRTVPIMVNVPDQENISAAYELVGSPTVVPNQVQIVGPAPIVERIDEVQTSISLANATSSVRETRPLRALNEQGREIAGIDVQPNQAQVSAIIRPKLNARNVSVQAQIEGTPPADYQISNISTTPDNVTLQGGVEQLSQIGDVINTLPVDVSQATDDFVVQVPLDLPQNVQALNNNGNPARTVTVSIGVNPRTGNMTITRPVELLGSTSGVTVTIEPRQVELLLSGPQPILQQVRSNPELVQIGINASTLREGQRISVAPELIAPSEIEAQLIPPTVRVEVE